MTPRLVLLEGLPGTGKTSNAEWICDWLNDRGVAARWFLEERHDHPVLGRAIRTTAPDPGFADRCTAQWRSFAESVQADRGGPVHVLEGCWFQSSIRFMLEYEHPSQDTVRYVVESERALSPLGARLIYFAPARPREYLRDRVVSRKGREIVDKIATYTGTTPAARRRGWKSMEGFVEFYSHYRERCDELVARSSLPKLEIDTVACGRAEVRRRISAWLAAAFDA